MKHRVLLLGRGLPVYTYRRFRGASPVYPTPRNREIGFVSFSFSFRAVRASGRGEAVRARCERFSSRWGLRVGVVLLLLLLLLAGVSKLVFVRRHAGSKDFSSLLKCRASQFVVKTAGLNNFTLFSCEFVRKQREIV